MEKSEKIKELEKAYTVSIDEEEKEIIIKKKKKVYKVYGFFGQLLNEFDTLEEVENYVTHMYDHPSEYALDEQEWSNK